MLAVKVVTHEIDSSNDRTALAKTVLAFGLSTIDGWVASVYTTVCNAERNTLAVEAQVVLLLDSCEAVDAPRILCGFTCVVGMMVRSMICNHVPQREEILAGMMPAMGNICRVKEASLTDGDHRWMIFAQLLDLIRLVI